MGFTPLIIKTTPGLESKLEVLMRFKISHLYTEPGVSFQISHKVDKYVEDKIIESIIQPYGLDNDEMNTFINLIVSTSSKTLELVVKGPDYDKVNDIINWGAWLPYKAVSEEKGQLPSYLKYLFDAIAIVLNNYSVDEGDIRKMQRDVENEVINNPEYLCDEEFVPPPDLDFLSDSH
jgi:hypothetical protein